MGHGKPNTVLMEAERAEFIRSLLLTSIKGMYARRRSWYDPYNNVKNHFTPGVRTMNRDKMRMLHYVLNYADPNPELVKSHIGRQNWRKKKADMLDWLEMSIEDTDDKDR